MVASGQHCGLTSFKQFILNKVKPGIGHIDVGRCGKRIVGPHGRFRATLVCLTSF